MSGRPVVVHKYGGSSVATVEKLRRVAEKVVATHRAGRSVVVVVSAMGDTTDALLALVNEVAPDPPKRELDMLLSVGERVSMALLSTAIQALGCDAISFTGSQCGIVTNDSHANARIIEVRPFRVADELARGRIVIVAGYQGTSYKREITTLGRGGSDTTAVALAAALGAEACEIYSDVDGVYTADPRVVIDAQRLATIRYEEMQELARLGARVLNAQAVEFARRAGIAIYAKSTFGGPDGTEVRRVDEGPREALDRLSRHGVVGVPAIKDAIRVTSPALAPVLQTLGGAEVIHANEGRDGAEVVASMENVADPAHVSAALESLGGTRVAPCAVVSVVGLGVGGVVEAYSRLHAALPCASLASFGGGNAISVVVERAEVGDAVRRVHAAFFDA